MDNEAEIKFLERILPISRFFTTPHISESTSKLLWILFILNSMFILIFSKVIKIKEITLLAFNIELSEKYLLIFISLAATILFIKIIFNYWSDKTNWQYELALHLHKFIELKKEVDGKRILLAPDTEKLYSHITERHTKLSNKFTKCQQSLEACRYLENPTTQEIEIYKFQEMKYNFISAILHKANKEHDIKMQQNHIASENISNHLDKLCKVITSVTKQKYITLISNFLLPTSTFIYIIYMLSISA